MKRIYTLYVTAVFLVLLSLPACSSRPDSSDPMVIAVENYCTVLQATYMQKNLNILAKVATEKELKRIFPIVQMLMATRNAMPTRIEKFEVVSGKTSSATTAQVETIETWEYWLEDASGNITKPKKKETYRLRYELVNENGMWKVDSLRHR